MGEKNPSPIGPFLTHKYVNVELKTNSVSLGERQAMKFCTQCSNFLYDIVERDSKAFLKCRSCPYEEPILKENPVVYEHDLKQDTSVQYSINPYLKYDSTLPRFTTMVCPNQTCSTRGKESDIVGIKFGPRQCSLDVSVCSVR
jgi:DNA-directed RNA polymerase subunit M/transcription elongation factor TFIIS